MNFGDIWLKTENFIKINLRDFKKLKISDLRDNPALINIFNSFDTQKADGTNGSDGELSKEELLSVFKAIRDTAKTGDNPEVFEVQEAEAFLDNAKTPDGKTLKELGVTSHDLFDFMLKLAPSREDWDEEPQEETILEGEEKLTDEQRARFEEVKSSSVYHMLSETKKQFLLEIAKIDVEITSSEMFKMVYMQDEDFSLQNLEELNKVLSDKDLDNINFLDALILAQLDDNQYELVKDIYKTQNEEKNFSVSSIADLVSNTLPEDYEYLRDVISRDFQPTTEIIDEKLIYPLFIDNVKEIVSIEKPFREKFFSIIEDKSIPESLYGQIAMLMPIWDNLPKDFLQKNPDIVIVNIADGNKKLCSQEMVLRYDKDGLYETVKRNLEANSITVVNNRTNNVDIVKLKNIPGVGEIVESETITEYDSITMNDIDNYETGNLVKTTTRELGNTEGVYIITETDANGNINPKQLQYETIDENGNTYVQRDCVSPAGVETHFNYEETVDGMVILDYVIIGKDEETGEPKTLLDKHQTIQQMGDGRVITTVNGNIYEAKFEEGKLTVTDKQKNITKTFELDNAFLPKSQDIVLNILKNVPANQLMVMDKIPINSVYYNETDEIFDNGQIVKKSTNNGFWSPYDRLIEIGKQERLDSAIEEKDYETILNVLLPIFLHEFGHYIDSDLITGKTCVISANDELNNVFKKEVENFLMESNSMQQCFIDYFINDCSDRENSAAQERVAESNMLLNGLPDNDIANRASYLQQYFPETIAKIAELIDERIQV